MTALSSEASAALAPVRRAMRQAAKATAEDIRSAASAQATALVDEAHQEADRIRAQATADGEADARATAELNSARARRRAHETVLAAQNSLRESLLTDLGRAATALREDPRYPELRANLEHYARGVLGPGAIVTESPAGGIVAEAGSHRLDLTLPVLAFDTAAAMPHLASSLWNGQEGHGHDA